MSQQRIHKVMYGTTERSSFSRIPDEKILPIPYLIELQRSSYAKFIDTGIADVLKEYSPIVDFSGRLKLEFLSHSLVGNPKYSVKECKDRDTTYAVPLRVKARLTNNETGESKAYLIPYGSRIKIQDGDVLEAGDELTSGSVNPHDILKIKGLRAVQDYMIQEVQRVYRLQGVEINDKHIEVIVRQMMRKLKVVEAGTTDLLPGATTDKREFAEANEKARLRSEETGEAFVPATCAPVLLGITKASLATDSFLSAASFQETTRVLTDAAIKGKIDPLMGLKENVIIGKLLPSGTGMKCYNDVDIVSTEPKISDEVIADSNFSEIMEAVSATEEQAE